MRPKITTVMVKWAPACLHYMVFTITFYMVFTNNFLQRDIYLWFQEPHHHDRWKLAMFELVAQ